MASLDPSSKDSHWPFFALGVGAVLAVGVLGALWILFRRLSTLPGAVPASPPVAAPSGLGNAYTPPFSGGGNGNYFAGPVHVFMGDRTPAPPIQALATVPASALLMQGPSSRESRSTTMQSYTLSDTTSLRIFTATKDSGWRVEVRVVGPPGSFGIFSTNSVLLDTDTYTQAMIIPAGATNVVDLAPKDVLYGKGVSNKENCAGTTISITANPTPIYG